MKSRPGLAGTARAAATMSPVVGLTSKRSRIIAGPSRWCCAGVGLSRATHRRSCSRWSPPTRVSPSVLHMPTERILCFRANPQTTQGEARSIAHLAAVNHWHRVIVVMPHAGHAGAAADRALLPGAGPRGRCGTGRVLGLGARDRLRVERPREGARAPAQLLREATRSQPSCDAGMTVHVVPCSRGAGWGTGMRGEQCRRASEPSRHAMCRRRAPPLPAPGSPIRRRRSAVCRRGRSSSSAWPWASPSSRPSRWDANCPTTRSGSSRRASGCWRTTPSSGWIPSATPSRTAAG